jgi:hypothetical protein
MKYNRQLIERVQSEMERKGIWKGGNDAPIATQGYLCLIQTIEGTFTNIQFDVVANTGTVRATELRLANTDMFTASHWSLNIVKATADTAAGLSAATRATFPNPITFAGTGEATNLMSIYNGNLSVTVDRTTLIDAFDCYRFYRAAQAQKGVGPAVIYQADEFDSQNYGFAELDPEFTLNGLGDNRLILNLPNSTTLSATTGKNFAMLILRGIRWQNASKVNP